MSDPQKKRKKDWKRTTLVVLCIVLSVILVLLAIAGAVLNYLDTNFLDRLNYVSGDTTISPEDASSIMGDELVTLDPNDTSPIVDASDVTLPPESNDPLGQGDHIVNILLIGQDARKGEGKQRSDSMILVTFNKSTRKITLTSFMRDSYVYIPGYGATKLCHAYQYGGMTLLNETIYNHYGIQVDGNVEVNFEGFEKIIDLLGGVEIELTSREAEFMNEDQGFSVKKGTQILNGEEALFYARIRHIDSDYKRTERQRKVIMSVFDEYKNQSLPRMLELMEEILPYVTTDMTKNEIKGYAMELFGMVAGSQMESMRLPAAGTYKDGYATVFDIPGKYLSCQVEIDFEANKDILREIFKKAD